MAQLTNATLDNLTSPLGPGVQTLTTPVDELTDGVIRGLGNTVRGLGGGLTTGIRSAVTSSAVSDSTSSDVTSSAVPAPAVAP